MKTLGNNKKSTVRNSWFAAPADTNETDADGATKDVARDDDDTESGIDIESIIMG